MQDVQAFGCEASPALPVVQEHLVYVGVFPAVIAVKSGTTIGVRLLQGERPMVQSFGCPVQGIPAASCRTLLCPASKRMSLAPR